MKIGFDLHGVLDTYPEKCESMIKMLKKTGHTVCIVSGPIVEKINIELEKLGYDKYYFSDKCSVVDFLTMRGVEFDLTDPDNPWCDEQVWWDAKARICKAYQIDYLIDDSLKYKPAFDLVDADFIHIDEIVKR